ncbi:homoserine kinase [Clostridium fermenticellae]|uniref:Homoserine kinase n=1 Tax=Clostridium fermenticellae TaxID=2068654 RepID=A0A386H2I7_9CLOT|nr:homoserine kinase [Clostridium fermenticellae]AYD39876.1 homoserine kinase [Clostridium fermenticellae]
MSKIKVKIPATTANMGPGFDTLGMALKLYNEIEVEETYTETEIYNDNVKSSDDYKDNLIYKSIINALDRFHYKYNGFKINVIKCDIPMSRGLGSSAACIVGGVSAANVIMGNRLTIEEIISIATDIEGHPDNVVPAVVGGMVVSINEDGMVNYSKISMPGQLKFAAMIPEFEVSTELSRKVLPEFYKKQDCIFNISRATMLVSSLYNEDFNSLRMCFDDKIHQPYRNKLINNLDSIFAKSKELGSVGEFISGSGSTLMAVLNKDEDNFVNKMGEFLNQLDDRWKIILLKPDMEGVKVM